MVDDVVVTVAEACSGPVVNSSRLVSHCRNACSVQGVDSVAADVDAGLSESLFNLVVMYLRVRLVCRCAALGAASRVYLEVAVHRSGLTGVVACCAFMVVVGGVRASLTAALWADDHKLHPLAPVVMALMTPARIEFV